MLVTTFRPEIDYPQIVAYVAWFDHTRTALAYYPGRYEPPNAAVRGPMMVPDDQRYRLLATFNAGFIYSDGSNGSSDNGLVNEPLTDGNATLIGYRNGRVAIVKWNGGPNAGPNVAWARQSLAPIVWNGQLNPELNENPNSPQWGYTLGGVTRVWRTGVGIDRRGNLIYVAANDQTVITLAKILQHVGAVDAMEFDINPDWHTLITYTHGHGLVPTMVEPQPDAVHRPLPRSRRPRLLRRLPTPARSDHGPLQLGIRGLCRGMYCDAHIVGASYVILTEADRAYLKMLEECSACSRICGPRSNCSQLSGNARSVVKALPRPWTHAWQRGVSSPSPGTVQRRGWDNV